VPQTATTITIKVLPANQQSNLSAGVNTGVTTPGNIPGALAGDSTVPVFSASPWLGAPIIFG
jgi:hypothetical protein